MKQISAFIAVVVLSIAAFAQAPAPAPAPAVAPLTNIYGAGVSFNNAGSPRIGGTALYARLVADGSGTYVFSVIDALPNNTKPLSVSTDVTAGIAQKVFSIKNTPVFIPTSAGVSFSGSNTGWAWSTGAMAAIKIKNNWFVMPTVRVAKSSVTGGTGYQPIVGLLFGWGQ